MYLVHTIRIALAKEQMEEKKAFIVENIVDVALNLLDNRNLIQALMKLNPFVVIEKGTYKTTYKAIETVEIENLIRYIVSSHWHDILWKFASLDKDDWSKDAFIAVSNVYLNKYLSRLEQEQKIKRILNPLSPDSYHKDKDSVIYYKILPEGYSISGRKSMKKYLEEQEPTYASYVDELVTSLDRRATPNDYVAKLLEFIFKYPNKPEVMWILNTVNKSFFTIKRKDGSTSYIDNELYDAELFKLLREKNISDKNLPLYELLAKTVEDLTPELTDSQTRISFDKLVRDKNIINQIIDKVKTKEGLTQFFAKFLDNYKAHIEKKREERKNRQSVYAVTVSFKSKNDDDNGKYKDLDAVLEELPDDSYTVEDLNDKIYFSDKLVRMIYAQVLANILQQNVFPKMKAILNTDEIANIIKDIIETLLKEWHLDTEILGLESFTPSIASQFQKVLIDLLERELNPQKLSKYFDIQTTVDDTSSIINLRNVFFEVTEEIIKEAIQKLIRISAGTSGTPGTPRTPGTSGTPKTPGIVGIKIFETRAFQIALAAALNVRVLRSILPEVESNLQNNFETVKTNFINFLLGSKKSKKDKKYIEDSTEGILSDIINEVKILRTNVSRRNNQTEKTQNT